MPKALSLLIVFLGLTVGSFAQNNTTFPKVVATFHRINQTDAIPATTLFTPKAGGLFRFTIYGVVLKADAHGYWTPTVTFTNELGQQSLPFTMQAPTPGMSFIFGNTFWDRKGFSDNLRRRCSGGCER